MYNNFYQNFINIISKNSLDTILKTAKLRKKLQSLLSKKDNEGKNIIHCTAIKKNIVAITFIAKFIIKTSNLIKRDEYFNSLANDGSNALHFLASVSNHPFMHNLDNQIGREFFDNFSDGENINKFNNDPFDQSLFCALINNGTNAFQKNNNKETVWDIWMQNTSIIAINKIYESWLSSRVNWEYAKTDKIILNFVRSFHKAILKKLDIQNDITISFYNQNIYFQILKSATKYKNNFLILFSAKNLLLSNATKPQSTILKNIKKSISWLSDYFTEHDYLIRYGQKYPFFYIPFIKYATEFEGKLQSPIQLSYLQDILHINSRGFYNIGDLSQNYFLIKNTSIEISQPNKTHSYQNKKIFNTNDKALLHKFLQTIPQCENSRIMHYFSENDNSDRIIVWSMLDNIYVSYKYKNDFFNETLRLLNELPTFHNITTYKTPKNFNSVKHKDYLRFYDPSVAKDKLSFNKMITKNITQSLEPIALNIRKNLKIKIENFIAYFLSLNTIINKYAAYKLNSIIKKYKKFTNEYYIAYFHSATRKFLDGYIKYYSSLQKSLYDLITSDIKITVDCLKLTKIDGMVFNNIFYKALFCDCNMETLIFLFKIYKELLPDFQINYLMTTVKFFELISFCSLETFVFILQRSYLYYSKPYYKNIFSAYEFIKTDEIACAAKEKLLILKTIDSLFVPDEFLKLIQKDSITLSKESNSQHYFYTICFNINEKNISVKIPSSISAIKSNINLPCGCKYISPFERAILLGNCNVINWHLQQNIDLVYFAHQPESTILQKKEIIVKKSKFTKTEIFCNNPTKYFENFVTLSMINKHYSIADLLLTNKYAKLHLKKYNIFAQMLLKNQGFVEKEFHDKMYKQLNNDPFFKHILQTLKDNKDETILPIIAKLKKQYNDNFTQLLKSFQKVTSAYKNHVKLYKKSAHTKRRRSSSFKLHKKPQHNSINSLLKKIRKEPSSSASTKREVQEINKQRKLVLDDFTLFAEKQKAQYEQQKTIALTERLLKKNNIEEFHLRRFLKCIYNNEKIKKFMTKDLSKNNNEINFANINSTIIQIKNDRVFCECMIIFFNKVISQTESIREKVFKTNKKRCAKTSKPKHHKSKRIKSKRNKTRKHKSKKATAYTIDAKSNLKRNAHSTRKQSSSNHKSETSPNNLNPKIYLEENSTILNEIIDPFYNTLLHVTSLNNDHKAVKLLLQKDAIYKKNKLGQKPFYYSFTHSPNETTFLHINHILGLIKKQGINILQPFEKAMMIVYLIKFKLNKYLEALFHLCNDSSDIPINLVDKNNLNLFENAIIANNVFAVNLMCIKSIAPPLNTHDFGSVLDLKASEPFTNDIKQIFEIIIGKLKSLSNKSPLPINELFTIDKFNYNLLHHACISGNIELIELLIKQIPHNTLSYFLNNEYLNIPPNTDAFEMPIQIPKTPFILLLHSPAGYAIKAEIMKAILPYLNIWSNYNNGKLLFNHIKLHKNKPTTIALINYFTNQKTLKNSSGNIVFQVTLVWLFFTFMKISYAPMKLQSILNTINDNYICKNILNSASPVNEYSLIILASKNKNWKKYLKIFLPYADPKWRDQSKNNILHFLAEKHKELYKELIQKKQFSDLIFTPNSLNIYPNELFNKNYALSNANQTLFNTHNKGEKSAIQTPKENIELSMQK